jgi:hypothetical protein
LTFMASSCGHGRPSPSSSTSIHCSTSTLAACSGGCGCLSLTPSLLARCFTSLSLAGSVC